MSVDIPDAVEIGSRVKSTDLEITRGGSEIESID